MKYKEWSANKEDKGWKIQIRKDINQSIKVSSTYDEFLALMKAKGYEMKNTFFDENSGKYITFRPLGKDRPVRGSAKSLGANFTKERIKERIDNKRHRSVPFSKSERNMRHIIDTNADPKFAESTGLLKWANKENLKIAAKTYSLMTDKNIHNFSELNERISSFQEQEKAANQSIVSLEHQMRELAETIKYTEQYLENKSYNDRYERVKDQDRFLRKYESHIILFAGAERMLQRKGIDPQHINLEKMRTKYRELLSKKHDLTAQHKAAQSEIKELEVIRSNMEKYLNIMPEEQDLQHEPGSTHEIQK